MIELNKQIESLKNANKDNYSKDRVIELLETINKKDEEIKVLKQSILNSPLNLKPGEKLLPIIFISLDQRIHYAIICKNTDKFKDIEESLYNAYPEYREFDNYFMSKGNKINRFKTIRENGIENSDIITLFSVE